MSAALPSMLEAARRALAHAHAPYSRFLVGACVRGATTTLGELLPLAFGPGAFERPEP
jgi:cytidine deaminase